MLDYNSNLQSSYKGLDETDRLRRKRSRGAVNSAMVVAASEMIEKGGSIEASSKQSSGSSVSHQRRLWVKDRSKDWWDKCTSPDYPQSEFKRWFRMGKAIFELICDELKVAVAKENTMLRAAIPVDQRVAVCIYRLATGEPLRLVSKRFGLGISTCHKIVLDVCAAIRSVLMPKYLQWPGEDSLRQIKEEFESISGIPNVFRGGLWNFQRRRGLRSSVGQSDDAQAANDVSNEVNVDVEKGGKKGGSVEEAGVKEVSVKKGVVKEAAVKEGAIKKGTVKEGAVKKGAVKEAVVKKGAVKEAVVKKGAVKEAVVKKGAVKEASVKKGAVMEDKSEDEEGSEEGDGDDEEGSEEGGGDDEEGSEEGGGDDEEGSEEDGGDDEQGSEEYSEHEVSEEESVERNKKKRKLSVKSKKPVKDERCPAKKNPAKDYRRPEKKLAKASNTAPVEKKRKKHYRRPAEKKRKMVKDNICPAEKKRRVVDKAVKNENRNRPDADAEEDEGVASISKRDDSDSDVEILDRFFSTHCRPHTLVDLMKDFSDEQVKSVVEIGFGGLLDLKLTRTVTTLLPRLVNHFDPVSWMFSISPGKEFVISPYDVYDVFELPLNNGIDVVESTRSTDLQLKQEWRSMFDVAGSAGIPLHKLEARIVQLKDGGELFKRLFVMVAFATFLAPVANRTADLSFVKALENVDEIKNFNWCKYVHERLCRAILKYKKSKSQDSVGGCLLLLEVVYFQRLKFRNEAQDCSLPLIKHWTDKKISDRVKKEVDAKSFGCGILDTTTYPISQNFVFGDQLRVRIAPEEAKQTEDSQGDNADDASLGKRIIKFYVPESMTSDEEIHSVATDAIHEQFLLMKRNMEVVTNYHVKKVESLKKRNVACASSSSSPVLQSQDYDPRMFEIIDEIVDIMLSMKKLPGGISDIACDMNVGGGENGGRVENVPGGDFVNNIVQNVIEKINLEYGENSFSSIIMNALGYGKAKISVGCGPCDVDVVFVGHVMKNNKKFLKKLPKLYQEIADYCFLDDNQVLNQECLVWFDLSHSVPREDMVSLAGNLEIFQSVIECWAMLLNENERMRDGGPKKFCFGVEGSLWDDENDIDVMDQLQVCWKEWIQVTNNNFDISVVDLVFVPIYAYHHLWVFALNMKKKTMQLLDNLVYEEATMETIKHLAAILCDNLSTLFNSLGHPEFSEVGDYAMEEVMFSLKNNKGHDQDCGVYSMMCMLLFEGAAFSCDALMRASSRVVLRVEICATLVLSDMNDSRQLVLNSLCNFNPRRLELAPEFAKRRKLMMQQKRKEENAAKNLSKEVKKKDANKKEKSAKGK
uniref:Ubiquitin-like protease family profile domain-containing protein n=1 Tax=Chenopodium quinoa TaxID=63459 RepID=A0A803KN02_CHEQI